MVQTWGKISLVIIKIGFLYQIRRDQLQYAFSNIQGAPNKQRNRFQVFVDFTVRAFIKLITMINYFYLLGP